MKIPTPKTLAIVILSILVIAQAAWIVTHRAAPADTLTVREIRVNPDLSGFEVAMTGPVNSADIPAERAATLSPELKGTWTWSSPSLLRFTGAERLESQREYLLTLAPGTGIEGERTFALRTGNFALEQINLSEEAGDTPGSAVITAAITFNGPVAPEDLLEHVTLVDESDNSVIPLQTETSWSSQYLQLRTGSIMKTTEGRTYRLTVTKGLKRAGSELVLERDAAITIPLRLDSVLTYRGVTATSSASGGRLSLTFSTPMDPTTAAGYITVKPHAEYTVTADSKELLLDGEFKPGQTYSIALRQGLTAADGAMLDKAMTGTITIPDISPAADFVSTGMFLPRTDKAGLAVDAVNTDTIALRVDRIYPNNLLAMLNEYGYRIFDDSWNYEGVPYSLGSALYETKIAVAGEMNQTKRIPLELGNTISPKDRGLYKVSVGIPGQNSTKRWLAMTDIGLVAKRDSKAFMVWAVSNTGLEPLSGIRLSLISDKNQPLTSAKTDAKGAARLPLPADDANGSPFMILAEGNNGDFTFLLPSRFGVDTTGLDVSGVTTPPAGLRAFFYGERDLYRPGETLKGMVVVRTDTLVAPPVMPLVLVQRDPKGREVRRIRLTTASDGTAPFELAIPDYALTGGHGLALMAGDTTIGTYEFKVEEFIPDRIKVEVKTAQTSAAPGETLRADIDSNYLFGPPAANLPVEVRALLRAIPFSAKGYEDYIFGDSDRPFQTQEFFTQEGTLNANGTGEFSIPVPAGLTPPATLEATVYGRVSETGGRGVTARKTVTIHPYSQYIGIKILNKNGYEASQPITFDFITTDPAGKPAAHGTLIAKLFQDRWRTVVRKAPSGGYLYESVNDPKLLSQIPVLSGSGPGTVTFTPPTYGSYQVVISSPESKAAARTGFFCGGWGYSPWALENPARIELVADKEQYRPGETAVIQIRAPFSGKLLMAVEGTDVHDTRIIDLTGNTGEVRFPVTQAYAPNVHVTAMLLRKAGDVTEGSVGRAFGAIPLLVDNLSNKLGMNIAAPDEVRPEAELAVDITAVPGAVVTIAAVDEGIMQLSGSTDPDPFEFFYARRALGVASYDTFAMLYPDLVRVMNAAQAGGGMEMLAESQFMRTEGIRRVMPVAFWSGPLTADAEGKIHYAMQLPDFQGALRIVAVGIDGKRFGTSRTMTRVRSPLVVTPTLPRFLATGDSIDMPVTLRNDLGKEAAITMEVLAEGAAETTATPVTLHLADGAEETTYLPISAKPGAGGAAKITVHATSGEESRRIVIDLPVRPALPYRREAAFGSLTEKNGELVPAAQGFVPGTVRRTVTMGGLPLARFTGKLEYLLGYPYGCAEQTASKAFPLIHFGGLAKAFAPQLINEKGAPFMVQSALMRLTAMQTDNGGFAFWPGEDTAEPWVSAYATHFLLEASQAGYTAPGMLQRAMEYMAELGTSRQDLNTTAYALFNLAKAGRSDRGSMDELRDKQRKSLSAMARTLLACAYALSNDMDSFNDLLHDMPAIKDGREPGGRMGSGLRDSALMLLALTDARPEDPMIPELATRVTHSMTVNEWGTTQEDALAFAALGKAIGTTDSGPFSGTLQTPETDYPFTDVTAFSMDTIASDGPISAEIATDNATIYWSVTTRGIPTEASVKPVGNGLEVRRTFLDRSGATVDIAHIEQGALVIMKTEIKPTGTAVENVVIQVLLPAGLEVENPRLETSEITAFTAQGELPITGHQDIRDDRILFFTDLKSVGWHAGYTQLRAVTPGTYSLPPVQAEAMYDPAILATGAPGHMDVTKRK